MGIKYVESYTAPPLENTEEQALICGPIITGYAPWADWTCAEGLHCYTEVDTSEILSPEQYEDPIIQKFLLDGGRYARCARCKTAPTVGLRPTLLKNTVAEERWWWHLEPKEMLRWPYWPSNDYYALSPEEKKEYFNRSLQP